MGEQMKRRKDTFWHFANDSRKLGYRDGRDIIIGQTLKVAPPIELCEKGLHASKRAIDALSYAPGAYVCLVTLGGTVLHDDDKSVATERTVIAAADATELLFRFSCDVAARALERAGVDHEDSWNAIAIRLAHMSGLADDADLSAAESAARSAAESAARSAAESAAESAAWSAARSAARSAAESAAESAAWSAAWSAARSAAESAAWSAEKQSQNRELERRLYKLLEVK
jgi:hypothetical protein